MLNDYALEVHLVRVDATPERTAGWAAAPKRQANSVPEVSYELGRRFPNELESNFGMFEFYFDLALSPQLFACLQ